MRQAYCLLLFTFFIVAGCTSSSKLFSRGRYQSPLGRIDTNLTHRTYLGLQIVQVELGGESYDFLFDTGAPMVVSPRLRKKLNMKVMSRKRVHDSQGKANYLNYVRMAPLELGGLVFENFTAIEADLRANAALACLDVDGIVGANLMRLFYWEMNPSQQVLRMTNYWDTLGPTTGMNAVNFRTKSTGTPVLDHLEINGVPFSNITFDTGSGGSLKLTDGSGALGSDSNAVVSVGYHSFGLFGGKIDTQSSSLVKLKIGNDSLAYFPLNVDKKKSSKLLGMAFFENYRTLLNWKQKKVYFEPVKEYSGLNDSVYAVVPVFADSILQVGRILIRPHGPEFNIALGDTILMVNNIKTYPAKPSIYCEVIAEMSKVNKTRLNIKGKGEYALMKQPKFSGLLGHHAKKDD